MKLTLEDAKRMMKENGGSLDLSHTPITSLPDGLKVGGYLDLEGTQITALPEGLTVGGDLYLRRTPITALPEGLAVGGDLYLRDTPITALPEDLKVGSYIFPHNPNIKKLLKHVLKDGDYVPGKYLYADGILTHVKNRRKSGAYTYYLGKIKGRNVVSDGTYWAHCRTLREGVADLLYKHAADRGAEQYRHLTLESILPREEAVTMYRVITGACQAGTQQFIERLPELKEAYSVREMIELTRGQYGADKFAEFFGA